MKFALLFLMCLISTNQIYADGIDKGIHGHNDLTRVEGEGIVVPQNFRWMMDAIGKYSVGCTATHIGNGLVITAGHCIFEDDLGEIAWGNRAMIAPYLTSKVIEVVTKQYSQEDGDYALLRVDPIPPVWIAIETDENYINVGDLVTIFSHPRGRLLEWSTTCHITHKTREMYIQHYCDTEGGSSGAAVINYITKKIVGIHNRSNGRSTKITSTNIYDYF